MFSNKKTMRFTKNYLNDIQRFHKLLQDEGWYQANERYFDFIRRHKNLPVLFLELGVGMNTPVIIKYPFWQMTYQNENAVYACVNLGEAFAPKEIAERSVCINGDIGKVFECL